jgi:hypothetical protein
MAMHEHLLPSSVLDKATLRGKEYAWPLTAVEEAVTAAAACGLASLSGNAQFRIPEATCDLYWLSVESGRRHPGEPWAKYVARSAAEVLARLTALRDRTDFTKEAAQWPVLNQLPAQGVDLNQYLCFVLYFAPEEC